MSSDSFSTLLKTEKEASELIQAAKEERKKIMKEHEKQLDAEIEQYRIEEQNRIRSEQQQADSEGGNRNQEDESATEKRIQEIKQSSKANMNAMVDSLVSLVVATS
eukprot:TRINITY_DN20242_c0_g2_i1.p2 TRINITY_DN20242_c0_g2~~TRINITY_DN20242_c0_g2_i1.p2  ORF type:complete len:106 (+),score=60.28 TRINITY_DN20242_c0_g2_i1:62-379(+)